MSFRTFGTALTALTVMVSAPLSAAVRPGSAVPTAASASSVSSAANNGTSATTPWPAYGIIALTAALGIWIATKNNDGKSISRG